MILVAGLMLLLIEASALNVLLALVATTVFALSVRRGFRLATLAPRAASLWLIGPFRLAADLLRVRRLTHLRRRLLTLAGILGWIAPLAVLSVFAVLLALGNPLLALWFEALFALQLPDLSRVIFVAVAFTLIWPLLHVRPALVKAFRPARSQIGGGGDIYFGATPLARALVLLNALFVFQGGTDVAYLWGGLALPPGMTYASYAHQSAYPLALTALVAAGFALLTLRPCGPCERSRWIQPLVLVFTAQNVALVCSAMFRLKLYIAAYGLTEMRLTALIWMALVASGLILIIARIARNKSNGWLVEMNARALALALCVAGAMNFPAIIAGYNLAHCREAGGEGPYLDWVNLDSLGPQAVPALDDAMPLAAADARSSLVTHRRWLASQAATALHGDWRAWSWRSAGLKTYLAQHPDAPALTN